eukprot:Hpha_TRINITY_DN6021_c0_g1::TRINITY_DN6021_c0_g1_i1::g.63513::m.63513
MLDELGQSIHLPVEEELWPILPRQAAEVMTSAADFLDVLYHQPHVDRIVVLKDGIRKLGQENAIPVELRKALAGSSTMRGFFDSLSPTALEVFKGRIWHFGRHGKATEMRGEEDRTLPLLNVKERLKRFQEEDKCPRDAPLYITELRHSSRVKHPRTGESVKTATQCDIYDIDENLAKSMPFWERSEGGVFIGERGSASGLHIDQILWSNVGRNWCGHKLLAIWPWKEQGRILDDVGRGKVFQFPLSEDDRAALRRAEKIALVAPGDAWVFSGGQPHSALQVGDGISVCAYESFIPACPEGIATLMRTNTQDHWKECWTDDDELEEILEEVVDNLQEASFNPALSKEQRKRVEICAQEMRDKGNSYSYCRRLWAIEDRAEGAKKRRVDPSQLIRLRERDDAESVGHSGSSSPSR